MSKLTAEQLRRKYDFSWDTLDIIIGGKSSIDSIHGFQTKTLEDADRFVRSYGYDLENPIERAEAFGNFHEATNFIRKYFLQPENQDGLRLDVPRKILELTDVRELLLMSSLNHANQMADTQGLYLRNWACAILKVMHTISHVDQDLRTSYFPDIQKQIFDRFYRVIHRDSEGQLYLGDGLDDPQRVNLVAFETKPKKSRDSILLKLLHKPENVAEDIFDRVGLRFVTETRIGALLVVKYLKDKMIVMSPNIKPSRSRNTLVDLDDFRTRLEQVVRQAKEDNLDDAHLSALLEEAALVVPTAGENRHSSQYYRAIQFTSRQLIKLKNPLYSDLKELKAQVKIKTPTEDILKLVDRIDLRYIQKESRFFYPYEVQIVDQRSFEENEKGRSAHSEYKKAQIQTALKRVMGSLVDVSR